MTYPELLKVQKDFIDYIFLLITVLQIYDMKSFLQNKKVKIFFSVVILISSVPSIYKDFTQGFQGDLSHYGLLIIGVSTLFENLLWVLDIWEEKNTKK